MNSPVKKQISEFDCAVELSEEMLERVVGGIDVHRGNIGHVHQHCRRNWGHHHHFHHYWKHLSNPERESNGDILDGLI
ncbi:MAG TPA: hypothetical protein VF458_16885 [Ktedonobacteraceae bacterium]